MMKKLFVLLFLVSCSSSISNTKSDKKQLNFNDNLSFQDFNKMLIQYVGTTPYPNID